jgi:hypothetical protein
MRPLLGVAWPMTARMSVVFSARLLSDQSAHHAGGNGQGNVPKHVGRADVLRSEENILLPARITETKAGAARLRWIYDPCRRRSSFPLATLIN